MKPKYEEDEFPKVKNFIYLEICELPFLRTWRSEISRPPPPEILFLNEIMILPSNKGRSFINNFLEICFLIQFKFNFQIFQQIITIFNKIFNNFYILN